MQVFPPISFPAARCLPREFRAVLDPAPNAELLADIAAQNAVSAESLGITAHMAMTARQYTLARRWG